MDSIPIVPNITVVGKEHGTHAFPNPAAAGQTVTVNAGTRPGFIFYGWIGFLGQWVPFGYSDEPQGNLPMFASQIDFADPNAEQTTFIMPPGEHVVIMTQWTPTPHPITIMGGGSGFDINPNPAPIGRTVAINAGAAPSGYIFDAWTSNPSVTFANPNAAQTTFVMVDQPVALQANWRVSEHPITIIGGGEGYSVTPNPGITGHNISIDAGVLPAGHAFSGWTSEPPVDFADQSAAQAILSSPYRLLTARPISGLGYTT